MGIVLFAFIHIPIGLALIYFYGKLPKALTTFVFVFLWVFFTGESFKQIYSWTNMEEEKWR
jgi:hypothetical protein